MSNQVNLGALSAKLGKAFAGSTGNVAFSPVSVALALGLLANGIKSGSPSLNELLDYFGLSHTDVKNSIEALNNLPARFFFEDSHGQETPATFLQANSVWGSVLPAYKDKVAKLYHAQALPTPSSGKVVNDWVKENTKGHLPALFSDGEKFGENILLINTVYFRGLWKSQFKPENTHPADFHQPNNSTLKVSMMKANGKYGHATTDNFAFVQLPYTDTRFRAVVALPSKNLKYEDALALVDQHFWEKVSSNLKPGDGTIEIPRFDATAETELSKYLASAGVTKIFTSESNLSELSADHMRVSKIIHKCRVEVDEEGSKASAATAVMLTRCMVVREEPFHFTCDRPFFFIITTVDNPSPLFFSYITSPTQSK